jgi:hypothetical protein
VVKHEDLYDLIAEQAAQGQVLLLVLRRLAAMGRRDGIDTRANAEDWLERGTEALDKSSFRVAEGDEELLREKAKVRFEEIIAVGLR